MHRHVAEVREGTRRVLRLADIAHLALQDLSSMSLEEFCAQPLISPLGWPVDVLDQFLYEHGAWEPFHQDYGHLDLSQISWTEQVIATNEFCLMPTGASEEDLIDHIAENPDHYIGTRTSGVHEGVGEWWAERGTWKRQPILLDRALVTPGSTGLQVLEGRTRVGVLKGRRRQGAYVAAQHPAWVGRPSTTSED
ncbi:hypothetical protein AB0M64_33115 [Streptomyces sp. NPDC051771]|uniref:hypothetical protein n=1 Tax=Streptomyces sp. NPDC051771 TaxID=3154847 RepID=UPI003419BCDE